MSGREKKPTGVEFDKHGNLRVVGSGFRHYANMAFGFLVLCAAVLLWALLNGVPAYEPPDHGRYAVCGDGTVLEPPWNSCGPEHDYLDHWTAAPPAPEASTATSWTPEPSVVEPAVSVVPTPEVCLDADSRGVIPRDRWTPCGQVLGYFDDWVTPPPPVPGVIMDP